MPHDVVESALRELESVASAQHAKAKHLLEAGKPWLQHKVAERAEREHAEALAASAGKAAEAIKAYLALFQKGAK